MQREANWQSDKTISFCVHCGDECLKNAKYCKFCGSADARRKMDEENIKISEVLEEKRKAGTLSWN